MRTAACPALLPMKQAGKEHWCCKITQGAAHGPRPPSLSRVQLDGLLSLGLVPLASICFTVIFYISDCITFVIKYFWGITSDFLVISSVGLFLSEVCDHSWWLTSWLCSGVIPRDAQGGVMWSVSSPCIQSICSTPWAISLALLFHLLNWTFHSGLIWDHWTSCYFCFMNKNSPVPICTHAPLPVPWISLSIIR